MEWVVRGWGGRVGKKGLRRGMGVGGEGEGRRGRVGGEMKT